MSRLLLTLAAAVTLLGLVGSATGGLLGRQTDRYEAQLTPGNEVPPVNSAAVGQFVGVFNKRTRVFVWVMRFGALSGPATAAHIHVGPKGKSGPVLVPLCAPCRNPSGGTILLTPAQAQAFRLHRPLYANIHTARNPAGEIRGQLVVQSDAGRQGCAPC